MTGTLTLSIAATLLSLVPDPRGYAEFRRRMEVAYQGKAGLPPLSNTVECQWIRYITQHCVGNFATRDGYKEFRRRLDVAYQYRYDPFGFSTNYQGQPNLDLNTIPPALPSTFVGGVLKEIVAHCAGNPASEAGYREFHRRVSQELLPKYGTTLRNTNTPESFWTLYMLQHIAGNFPIIEK